MTPCLLCCLLLPSLAAASAASSFNLTGDAVWIISPFEPPAVANALLDVRRDAYKVLGIVPIVLPSPPPAGSLPPGTVLIYAGSTAAAPWLAPLTPVACNAGWEAHCVLALPRSAAGLEYDAVLATGSGVRGAVYAAYTLAERVLGVNPLYLWTDDEPEYSGVVAVPGDLNVSVAPPVFKYRGMFVNDEDLTAAHWRDATLRAAADGRAYANLFETALRLKLNTVIPATNPFADQDVYTLAGARGLVSAHHHYDLCGGNTFAWPLAGTDWDWRADPGSMAALWRASIAAQAGLPEVLWSVGLRGLNDVSYDACETDEVCGRLISEAMGNQTAWIRAAAGDNATIIAYLWSEGLSYLTAGYLTIPPGVSIIFTDAGNGYIRVDGNFSTYSDGVYYHTAAWNGVANQLSEMIPLDRIIAQFAPVFNASNSTTVVIDNVSDLKPVVMTSQALWQMAWDPAPFFANPDPNATALQFYAQWGARQLHIPGGASDPAAQAFASIWRDYFLLPYIQAGMSDNFIVTSLAAAPAHAAVTIAANGTVSPADVAAIDDVMLTIGGAPTIAALGALLMRAEQLQPVLPAARQAFFAGHTLLQVAMHAHGVAALASAADCLHAAALGNWSAAGTAATASLASMEAVLAAMRVGEAGKWRGWYFGDTLTNMQQGRAVARSLLLAIANGPASGSPLPPLYPNGWYPWDKAYELTPAAASTYPYITAYSPEWSFSTRVRSNCNASAWCIPNADGGLWKPAAGATITLQLLDSPTAVPGQRGNNSSFVIHFTLDGSAPSTQDPAYIPGSPISLDAACNNAPAGCIVQVTAVAFDDSGTQLGMPQSTQWLPSLS